MVSRPLGAPGSTGSRFIPSVMTTLDIVGTRMDIRASSHCPLRWEGPAQRCFGILWPKSHINECRCPLGTTTSQSNGEPIHDKAWVAITRAASVFAGPPRPLKGADQDRALVWIKQIPKRPACRLRPLASSFRNPAFIRRHTRW